MNVEYDASFLKSINKLKNKSVEEQIAKAIANVKNAETIAQIPGNKKLKGYSRYYRIRIGNYRIGYELTGQTVRFIIVADRKDIYNMFP